jgi:hypothetical protein
MQVRNKGLMLAFTGRFACPTELNECIETNSGNCYLTTQT